MVSHIVMASPSWQGVDKARFGWASLGWAGLGWQHKLLNIQELLTFTGDATL